MIQMMRKIQLYKESGKVHVMHREQHVPWSWGRKEFDTFSELSEGDFA